MFKNKQVKQAEEMLDILEDKPKHKASLVGGFVTILVGMNLINETGKQIK